MSENVLVELSEAMAAAAERAGKSTLTVNARRRMPASGIVYAAGQVLTADHVVEREDDIRLNLPDGSEVPASLAGRDPGSDLALLKFDHPGVPAAEAARDPARVGQLALVIGRPSAEGIEASLGVVSAIGGPVRTGRGAMLERYIRTDTISYPGFSGGPLVDAAGRVLGVNTSGLARGLPLTIPVDLAWRVAEALATHGHVKYGYLGIRSQPVEVPAAAQKALKRQQATGLLIVGVEDDSPAAKGDLMVGDILVGMGGSPVSDPDELFQHLGGEMVGKSVRLEIVRGGQVKVLDVTVGERS